MESRSRASQAITPPEARTPHDPAIPASLDRAYLLSIPRDLRVKIPAFAPTNFRGATHEKINGAFQYGGGGEGACGAPELA